MLEKKAVDAAKSGVYFYIPSLSEVHKERLRRAGHSPRKRTKCGDMTFYSEMDIEFVREASDPSEVVLFEQGWTAFVALLLALPEEEFPKAKVLDLMAFKSALDLRRHPAENKADFIDCMFQKFPGKIGEWQSLAESNAALNNDILRDGHGPRATEAALSTMARSRLAKAAPSLGAAQVSQPQGASGLSKSQLKKQRRSAAGAAAGASGAPAGGKAGGPPGNPSKMRLCLQHTNPANPPCSFPGCNYIHKCPCCPGATHLASACPNWNQAAADRVRDRIFRTGK